MTIKAIRVSKTSMKPWYLSGPVDQALLTSTQAKGLKVVSLHLDDVHGEPADCELWTNNEEWATDDESNIFADMILVQHKMRSAETVEAMMEAEKMPSQPVTKGVAILTGVGGTDFPKGKDDKSKWCILQSLLGKHPASLEVGHGEVE
jgi:hypothetical protein